MILPPPMICRNRVLVVAGLIILPIAPGVPITPVSAQQFQDQTSVRFPQPDPLNYTNYVEVGDIDNDGDLDIIWANGGNFGSQGVAQPLRIYINNGVGAFADETAARADGLAGNFRGVALGDVDGDGDLDLIAVNDFDQLPKLMINNGSGVYDSSQSALRLPNLLLASTRAQFGDIDNDGDLDIYINDGAGTRFGCGQNRIYINDGLGFFTDDTAARHPIAIVCSPMDVIFGDVDGDFDLDVRTSHLGSNNSRLYLNNGSGVFTQVATPGDSTSYSYDFGDIDGDGDLDILGANGLSASSAEILLRNNGGGSFTNVSSQISPNISQDDNDSKFIDYDNDGDLDLLIARLGSGGERLYNNDGSGNFTQVFGVVQVISDSTLDIVVADFNNDGRYDFVTAQGESGGFTNRIYMNMTGPVDTIAPNIVNTEQVPDACGGAGPFVVRTMILDAHTSDSGFYGKGVFLNYTVNGVNPPTSVSMTWVGNSIWRGEIPAQPGGGKVQYFVTAIDWASNFGTGPSLSFTIQSLAGDTNNDNVVDVTDLLAVLGSWGPCPKPCPPTCAADTNGDCSVDVTDLLAVLGSWGSCP